MTKFADREAFRSHRKSIQDNESASNRRLISLCAGSGCGAYGTADVHKALQEELVTQGLQDSVEIRLTGCHGFCEKGPIMVIHPEEVFYPQVTAETIPEIVEQTLKNNEIIEKRLFKDPATKKRIPFENDIPFYKLQKRIIFGNNGLIDPTNIDHYIAVGGYEALEKAVFDMKPAAILEEVKKSGLRGRGGGGFPTGIKWATCAKHHGDRYVICNADEGDPGAYMDRSLLEGNPHSVLEGMIIAAVAIGSKQGYVYVRHEYPLAVTNLGIALEKAREYGLLGKNILGSGTDFDVKISRGGGAFVCGESTALMASLEGKPGRPRAKYIHTVAKGFRDSPSNLNNVETYANVPVIINKGADWYSAIGTEHSKGTKIFSLVGQVVNTGLVEVPMGTTLRQIVFDIGGGIPRKKKFKAVQSGGPSGGCIPERFLDLPVDFDELTKVGAMMGSGGMIVMDQETCMVDMARFFMEFIQDESCGKCVPCREGTRRLLQILEKICDGRGEPADIEALEKLSEGIKASALCGLGTSAPNPVLTTMQYFRDEYEAHIYEKRCPAKRCVALVEFRVDPELCTACGACFRACPAEAIEWKKKEPARIDKEKCIKCMTCFEKCNFGAIF